MVYSKKKSKKKVVRPLYQPQHTCIKLSIYKDLEIYLSSPTTSSSKKKSFM